MKTPSGAYNSMTSGVLDALSACWYCLRTADMADLSSATKILISKFNLSLVVEDELAESVRSGKEE